MRLRAPAISLYAALVAFVVLTGLAMARYPGGTWCHEDEQGLDFWLVFFCDLTHAHALNGSPNPAQGIARAGLLALVAGFVPFWFLASRLVAAGAARTAIVALGLVSVAGLVAVPLVPTDRYGGLHALTVMLAGGPGLLAAVLVAAGHARRATPRALRVVAPAACGVALVTMALYLRAHFGGIQCSPALPVGQKIAAALLLAWMALVARASDVASLRGG